MSAKSLLWAALFLGLWSSTSAYLVDPPSTASADTVSDCSGWHVPTIGDSCDSIAEGWLITTKDFIAYNPSVGSSCKLIYGNSYCVERNFGVPQPDPTTSSSTSTSTMKPTPTNGISTPTPFQSGMVSNCDDFYLVKDNDNCYNIAQAYKISLDQFYAWNPAVGNTCGTLWPTNYVCVSIIGIAPTTFVTTAKPTSTQPWLKPPLCTFDLSKGQYVCPSATPTPTKGGNGIATPTPFQSGMVNNCKRFYKVVKGDGCWAISQTYNIALDDFYKWNPGVGSTCATLQLDNYVCIGI